MGRLDREAPRLSREVRQEMERLRRGGIREEFVEALALDKVARRHGRSLSVRTLRGGLPGLGKRR